MTAVSVAAPKRLVEVTIDGQTVSVTEGSTILDACRRLGIETPTLCYADTLTPVNVCRVCVVEIEGARVLNDVDYTQVCVSFGDDGRTRDVVARLIADGTVWMSGSRWHDQDVLRVSVSNWSTDEADVERSVDAVRNAAAAVTV